MPHRGGLPFPGRFRDDKSARKKLLLKISCNPLISLDSDERIQGNPRKSKPQNLGFSQRNGCEPRKPKPARRTASRPPSRTSQTDSIQMHSGLVRAANKLFVLDGERLARLDLDSLRHADTSVGELHSRVIGAALHTGHFQSLVM